MALLSDGCSADCQSPTRAVPFHFLHTTPKNSARAAWKQLRSAVSESAQEDNLRISSTPDLSRIWPPLGRISTPNQKSFPFVSVLPPRSLKVYLDLILLFCSCTDCQSIHHHRHHYIVISNLCIIMYHYYSYRYTYSHHIAQLWIYIYFLLPLWSLSIAVRMDFSSQLQSIHMLIDVQLVWSSKSPFISSSIDIVCLPIDS